MANQAAGFTFKEKMAGGFALGESDPVAGEKLGHSAGDILTMHGTIVIDDLDRFMADAEHPGSLSGSIDFPPLGLGMASTKGVFNLFSPTDDPTVKYMVYEMGFIANNSPYYMAGHKIVKDAPVVDLWKATTTLYTLVHRGADATGPVAGAGIISLGVGDLLAMIPTMHATHTDSAVESAEAVGRFGKFFLGELWETYVTKAGA